MGAKRVVAFLIVLLALPAWCIVVCHDYTHYRAFGVDPSPPPPGTPAPPPPGAKRPKGNGIGVAQLRAKLKADGYREFPITVKAHEDPDEAQRHLRVGDVILLGDAHSGIVSDAEGHIDHWLQVLDHSGEFRPVDDKRDPLPPGAQGTGGLYLKDDLKTFLKRPFRPVPDCPVVVWRKVKG